MPEDIHAAVHARWDSLTKPPGSLGRLESLVADYAAMRGEVMPAVPAKAIYIFCADHGVTAEGVSAWPSEVTAQMVRNFLRGGAAISVLGRELDLDLVVVDAGVNADPIPGALDRKVRRGTANFATGPAMTRAEAELAIRHGRALAADSQAQLAGLGEMGIGNTTAASALASVFTGLPPAETVGSGAALPASAHQHKCAIVARALALHRPDAADPIRALATVGGLEIAMMTGFVLGCAARRLPVMVDGFITTAAVLAAVALEPGARDFLFFSHCSAEKAHRAVLAHLDARPILDLGLRLGEGSGAALAMGLLSQAIALYRGMATFAEAAVAEASVAEAK